MKVKKKKEKKRRREEEEEKEEEGEREGEGGGGGGGGEGGGEEKEEDDDKHLGQDKIRTLCRSANLLGQTLLDSCVCVRTGCDVTAECICCMSTIHTACLTDGLDFRSTTL